MGYGEKHEMQGLNEILEGCLGEMQQLEAETAEFEKRIAEMEGNPCRRTRRHMGTASSPLPTAVSTSAGFSPSAPLFTKRRTVAQRR